mgnify:CR=1 FL=1
MTIRHIVPILLAAVFTAGAQGNPGRPQPPQQQRRPAAGAPRSDSGRPDRAALEGQVRDRLAQQPALAVPNLDPATFPTTLS